MTESFLTEDRILDTAEEVLRRFGPAKATMVDVARALDVSHGSIYRHFPSKAALRDAVTQRWLHRVSEPLAIVATEEGRADQRLRRWLDLLIATKRHKVRDDPELFATYHALAEEAREVVGLHVQDLVNQIEQIIQDGVLQGRFDAADPPLAAKAVFDATTRFHHPAHALEWDAPSIDSDFEGVWQMVMNGLLRHPELRKG